MKVDVFPLNLTRVPQTYETIYARQNDLIAKIISDRCTQTPRAAEQLLMTEQGELWIRAAKKLAVSRTIRLQKEKKECTVVVRVPDDEPDQLALHPPIFMPLQGAHKRRRKKRKRLYKLAEDL